jgi:plastocyanin
VVALEARNFLFSPTSLRVPADRAFGIAFSNQDAAIPHDVTITAPGGALRFSGRIVTGVASVTYAVPALEAGTYRLGCIVHPAMAATLTVD